jgi:hypothetical protein
MPAGRHVIKRVDLWREAQGCIEAELHDAAVDCYIRESHRAELRNCIVFQSKPFASKSASYLSVCFALAAQRVSLQDE